jgi:hypothetical protein
MKLARVLALAGLAAAGLFVGPPADAAAKYSIGGYAAFRPFPNYSQQQCIAESYSAAVNNCGTTQGTMIFELVADQTFITGVAVGARSYGTGSTFTCMPVAYDENNSTSFNAGNTLTFASGQSHQGSSLSLINPGSLRLNCFNVPAGRGIGGLDW